MVGADWHWQDGIDAPLCCHCVCCVGAQAVLDWATTLSLRVVGHMESNGWDPLAHRFATWGMGCQKDVQPRMCSLLPQEGCLPLSILLTREDFTFITNFDFICCLEMFCLSIVSLLLVCCFLCICFCYCFNLISFLCCARYKLHWALLLEKVSYKFTSDSCGQGFFPLSLSPPPPNEGMCCLILDLLVSIPSWLCASCSSLLCMMVYIDYSLFPI